MDPSFTMGVYAEKRPDAYNIRTGCPTDGENTHAKFELND